MEWNILAYTKMPISLVVCVTLVIFIIFINTKNFVSGKQKLFFSRIKINHCEDKQISHVFRFN